MLHMKHLKVVVKFRQLFISLALRKCKNDCKIPKVILGQGFCPLKAEIGQFPIGFRLNHVQTQLPTKMICVNEISSISDVFTIKRTVVPLDCNFGLRVCSFRVKIAKKIIVSRGCVRFQNTSKWVDKKTRKLYECVNEDLPELKYT